MSHHLMKSSSHEATKSFVSSRVGIVSSSTNRLVTGSSGGILSVMWVYHLSKDSCRVSQSSHDSQLTSHRSRSPEFIPHQPLATSDFRLLCPPMASASTRSRSLKHQIACKLYQRSDDHSFPIIIIIPAFPAFPASVTNSPSMGGCAEESSELITQTSKASGTKVTLLFHRVLYED